MEYLIESTNGLLVPGGNSNLYKNYEAKEGYGEVTIGFRKVWRLVCKLWNKGIRYPVWGTCLGLELVLMMITEDTKVLSTLNSRNHTLEGWTNYEDSAIFKDMPTNIRVNIENKPLLNFFHRHGISLSRFLYNEKYDKLRKELKLISASKDKDGLWFCSFLEGIKNPIFISQFHPEKQAYEWNPTAVINHHY
jgi:gamma-glutamyl hydrolase